MAETIGGANLELGADATGMVRELGKAGQAAKQFDATIDKTAQSHNKSQTKMERDAERAARTLKLQQDRMVSYINRIGRQAGKSQSEYLAGEVSRLGIDPSRVKESLAALKQQEQGIAKVGMSAKQTAQAMRLLPAQITDIVVSLASGQPAYMVALQQGGQLKDMFGGIGASIRALLSVFTPLRIAIIAVGTALAAVTGIFLGGLREVNAYNTALALTNNYAGQTAGSLNAMAQRIAQQSGTVGQAAAALTALARTGRFSADNIELVGTAVVAMNRKAGVAISETVEQFVELSKAPTAAITKLDEQYRFLTSSTYAQIRALEEQGKIQQAVELAVKTWATASIDATNRVTENLSLVEKAWKRVKEHFMEYVDYVRNYGRPLPIGDEVAAAQAKVDELRAKGRPKSGFAFHVDAYDKQLAAAEAALANAQERQRVENETAEAARKTAEKQERAQRAAKAEADFARDYRTIQQQINDEIQLRENLLQRTLTQAERQKIIDKFSPKTPKAPAVRDDTATRMLQESRERQNVLLEELGLREKLGAAAKRLLEFEAQISNIAGKGRANWTDADKAVWAAQESLRVEYDREASLERQRDATIARRKEEEKAEEARKKRLADLMQMEDQLDSMQRSRNEAYESALGIAGMSDRLEEELKQRRALVREYERMRAALAKKTDPSDYGTEEYKKQVEAISDALDEAIRKQDEFNAARQAQRTDPQYGTDKAFANYADMASDKAKQVEDAWMNTFSGIEDVFADFATTGKLEFKDLADSIISDLVRIYVRALMVKAITGIMGAYDTGGLDNLIGAQSAKYPMATGTNYVPYDGFQATLHRGEAVVPAKYNPAAGGQQSQQPIIQYITVNGGGGGGSGPAERDQMRRAFRDGVRANLAEARGRNSPVAA